MEKISWFVFLIKKPLLIKDSCDLIVHAYAELRAPNAYIFVMVN
jgi:hypothetical protein